MPLYRSARGMLYHPCTTKRFKVEWPQTLSPWATGNAASEDIYPSLFSTALQGSVCLSMVSGLCFLFVNDSYFFFVDATVALNNCTSGSRLLIRAWC